MATAERALRAGALDAIHTALGAEWIDSTTRWALSYGDPASEAAAVAEHAGLAEIGPLDKVMVRGQATAVALERF